MTAWADLFGDITVVQAITWILALVAFALLALRGWKLLGALKDFLDDVKGEPARPGVPARAGLMERVQRIEHEVLPNTGTSLNDAVRRTDEAVVRLEQSVSEAHDKLDNDHHRINKLVRVALKNHQEDFDE